MKILTLTLVFAFSLSLYSQRSVDREKLNTYFELLEANNKFMGGVSIYKGDTLIYEQYCGFADIENQKQANNLTKYRIGSISKMFTSVLVFKFIEQGKLSLDDKLSKFYPSVKNADIITISQLLNHHSGIHNFTDDKDYPGYMILQKSREQMLDIIVSKSVDFEPGEKGQYSNSNYVLLSLILEEISGQTYSDLVQDYICRPYGLKHTKIGDQIKPDENEAYSYSFQELWVKRLETNMSITMGAGSLISVPGDLNLFIQKLFNGEILPDYLFQQMIEMEDGFGRGIFQFPFYDKTLLGHNGGIDGFRSNLAIYPEEKISLAVTGNGFNYDLNDILLVCLSEVFDKDYELPDFSAKKMTWPQEELKKLEGSYASSQIPLKISLALKEGVLFAQASGQAAFPLTSFEGGSFRFEPAGVEIVFKMDSTHLLEGEFELRQRGAVFKYVKE